MKFWKPATLLGAASFAFGMGLSGSVFAQTSAAASSDQLEEVVVTAEKRAVNLQKVPVSIQVKEGEDLAKTGKKRIDDIMQGTVGIQAQDSQVGVTFFVRGVDSSGGMGNVVAVPILVDGVAQSRSEAVRGGTLDVSQVEIMRGPQSTTVGVNALAGAVSLVTNKPSFQYEANGTVDLGNFNFRAIEGVLNAPLADNQALRLAFSTEKRDGYISSGAGDSDLANYRLKYRLKIGNNIDTIFTASQQKIGGNGVQAGVLLAYGHWAPYSPTTVYTNDGVSSTGGVPLTGGCTPGGAFGTANLMGCPPAFIQVSDDGTNNTDVNASNSKSFRQRSNAWDDGYPAHSFPNGPYRDTTIDLYSEEVNWDTGFGTLTVLPSFQHAHFLSKEPPRGTSWMEEDQLQNTTTVDVRMASPASGSKLTWLTGLYYSYDKVYDYSFKGVNFPGAAAMGPPGSAGDCATSTVYCYTYDLTPLAAREGYSGYANLQYSLLDTLRLIGAVRYNHDTAHDIVLATVNGDINGPDASEVASAGVTDANGTWTNTTFRAGLEYDVLPQSMLYATYSTGYTPGAIDTMSGSVTPKSTLRQIALGVKNRLLDNRLELNAEAFYTTFYNRLVEGTLSAYLDTTSSLCQAGNGPALQVIQGSTGGWCAIVGQNTATMPRLRSEGLDLDAAWAITPDDRLSVTAEYLKATYQSAPSISGNPDTSAAGLIADSGGALDANTATELAALLNSTLTGFTGAQLQNSPKFSATLDYSHAFRLAGGSVLTPRVNAVYKTRYWSFGGAPGANITQILADSSNPNDLAWQQAYSKYDLFLGWESADDKLTVTGYVKNVSDRVVLANYTAPYVSLEAPRTFGATFNARF